MYSPLSTTQLDGLQIAYRVLGQGPDVVFVHGWGSSSRMWQLMMDALAPRFRCWALDLAGFGDSQKPPSDWYSIPNYVSLVADFMAQMGIARAPVIGHSMGGMIAVTMAVERPALVSRVVAVSPVVTGKVHLDLRLLSDSPLSKPMLALGRWVWPIATSDWRRANAAEGRSIFFDRIREDWQKASADSTIFALRAISQHNAEPRLLEIKSPTLVIVGNRDLTAPNGEGRLIAQRVPGAHLVVLPAGHLPTDDLPDTMHALVEDFLIAGQPEPVGG